jgi:hypothetical protein
VAPAFDYARASHETFIVIDDSVPPHNSTEDSAPEASAFQEKLMFHSENLSIDCRYVVESTVDNVPLPVVSLQLLDLTQPTADGGRGHLGLSGCCDLKLVEGQVVTFILRSIEQKQVDADRERSKEIAIQSGNTPNKSQLLIPSLEKAKHLGVEYESEQCAACRCHRISPTCACPELVLGFSKLRGHSDPFLTKELLHELFTVCTLAHILIVFFFCLNHIVF